MTDSHLLKIYELGFSNYLKGIPRLTYGHDLEQKAYNIGEAHAWAGDDCESIDGMTDKDILKEVKS